MYRQICTRMKQFSADCYLFPYFFVPYPECAMRTKKSQRLYTVVLQYPMNVERSVKVRAVSREVAEARALKRNPNATGVKYDA